MLQVIRQDLFQMENDSFGRSWDGRSHLSLTCDTMF